MGKISKKRALIISVFIAGLCSIIYELLISTTSSYFLGDSIKQFSITIGVYMAAMGGGAFLSKFLKGNLLAKFIEVELLLGFIGGSSVPVMYMVYAFADYGQFYAIMLLFIILIGVLTGLEIPLLSRIMKDYFSENANLANVLSLDYLGALLATLIFPFLLLPILGIFVSSLVFGAVNIGIGVLNIRYFSDELEHSKKQLYSLISFLLIAYFFIAIAFSSKVTDWWNDHLFIDQVIFHQSTPYQTLTLTSGKGELKLFLNKVIQFNSEDEYRYHEALVHIPFGLAKEKRNILILGGGECLAAREVLKHPEVEQVVIVDIDPAIFDLARKNIRLKKLNAFAMENPKVHPILEDAFVFLKENEFLFDIIISDLPDPTNEALTRLYSSAFYKLIQKRLSPGGVFVTQATDPYRTNKAFWCIEETIHHSAMSYTYPYHAYVPSFGDWGFILASKIPLAPSNAKLDVPTKFLEQNHLDNLFYFPKDISKPNVESNTLDKPKLLAYYLEAWHQWSRLNVKE